MAKKPLECRLTWQSLTAIGMAFSLLLSMVLGDRTHAQTASPKSKASLLQRYTSDLTAAAEQGQFDSFTDNQAETRKAVDRAKGRLMDNHQLSENDAFSFIQKTAMRERVTMKQIAERILSGERTP